MIKVERASFGYGNQPVLSGIDAQFPKGCLTGIIGPNGSGKSTLIKLLSGQLIPRQGRVLLNGAPVSGMRAGELARRISVVPQQSHLDFDFSALDVVLMGRTPYIGRFSSESELDLRIALKAMEDLHIAHLAGRPAPQISGGEWQRVVMARALCQQTPVMLLDEPVSNLDIRHQLEVLEIVRGLTRSEQKTAVCVLHDLNLAAHYCDRILLLSEGQVDAFGTPSEVLTPAAIHRVYGVSMRIKQNSAGGIAIEHAFSDEVIA